MEANHTKQTTIHVRLNNTVERHGVVWWHCKTRHCLHVLFEMVFKTGNFSLKSSIIYLVYVSLIRTLRILFLISVSCWSSIIIVLLFLVYLLAGSIRIVVCWFWRGESIKFCLILSRKFVPLNNNVRELSNLRLKMISHICNVLS